MKIEDDREKLQALIDQSSSIVFFGGAGVSTESGIPDFRSQDGLYNQKWKYPPEEILSNYFFYNNPEEFYEFYREKILILDKKPNACHTFLKELEDVKKLRAIITQNIDNLHEMAGSKRVIHLHGLIEENYCTCCHKKYSVDFIKNSSGVPHCLDCGGLIKPNVVLYGEFLNDEDILASQYALSSADLLLIAGTSLKVYPACQLIDFFHGKNTVYIDHDNRAYFDKATLTIHQKVGELFKGLHI